MADDRIEARSALTAECPCGPDLGCDALFDRIAALGRTFLWQVDTGGMYTFVSGSVESILGYRPEEIVGNARFGDLHSDDGRNKVRALFEEREPFGSLENPLRTKDGTILWFSTSAVPLFDEGGDFCGYRGMATDITGHKRTELMQKAQYAVSDRIATAGTLAEIVDAARRELGALMDTRQFVLAEYDARTETISAEPFPSGDGKELLSRWSGEKSLTGMVIRNRKAMRFSKSEIRKLADDGVIELVGARAEVWLGVPLLGKDNVFGAIFVQSYDNPAAYDDASMEILQIVANQISVYMEKKRAEEKLRESEETFRTFFEQNCVGFAILDSHGKWLRFNDRFCEMTGYSRPKLESMTWADFAPQEEHEREAALYSDAARIGESGLLDFEKRFIRRDGSIIDVSVSSKLVRKPDGTVKQIASIIQDITERKRFEGLLTRKAEELERHQEAIIASMAILAEYRDHGTGEHVLRTKEYVRLLLERSGGSKLYPPEHLPLLWQAAALHDIGKVGIPDMILLKPGELTPDEFEIAKRHTVIGSEVLEVTTRVLGEVPFIAYARQITEFHHEKWDGSGYPNGLKGEEIPFIARVMAIADVYDALVTERPYKKPIPHEEAVAVIAAGAGTHFDPRLVDVFLGCESEFKAIARRIV